MTNRRTAAAATAVIAVGFISSSYYVWGQQAGREPTQPVAPDAVENDNVERDVRRLMPTFGGEMGMSMPTIPPPTIVWNREERPLARAAQKLAEQHAAATDERQRAEIVEQLREVVEKHFELRQQGRAKELDALEAELVRLRETHQRREEQRQEIVEDRVEDLLRDAEGLGWGSSGGYGAQMMGRASRMMHAAGEPDFTAEAIEEVVRP